MPQIGPIVLATRNAHKLREVRQILAAGGWSVDLRGLDEFPDAPDTPETGTTFAENAVAKAQAAAFATGLIALADDSGLEVDALGGRPGIESNRFAGPDADDAARIAKLLGLMQDVPDAQRAARFRCAAAVATPGGEVTVVEGVCEGTISDSPRGDSGFGYDPVFVPLGHNRTFAEMSAEEKNRLSHRGRAFRAAATMLTQMAQGTGDPAQAASP